MFVVSILAIVRFGVAITTKLGRETFFKKNFSKKILLFRITLFKKKKYQSIREANEIAQADQEKLTEMYTLYKQINFLGKT